MKFTYEINGRSASFLGNGDLHDEKFDDFKYTVDLAKFFHDREDPIDENDCFYSFDLYPSTITEADYMSDLPTIVSALAALTVGVMIMIFLMYEWFVQNKNRKVTLAAAKASKIVSSLFPDTIRDRVYEEQKVGPKPANTASSLFPKEILELSIHPSHRLSLPILYSFQLRRKARCVSSFL